MLLATYPITSGKTVSYKIIDKAGTVVQDWTTSGVTERQIDATANKSIYQVESNAITAGFEGHVWWKSTDTPPQVYSQTINTMESLVLTSSADVSTLLSRLTANRSSYLDTLARRVEIPAAPTFTAAAGTLASGTYYYRITALHPWGESMPSEETNIVTVQVATPTNEAFTDGAGTLAPDTYYYRVSAINAVGETLASTETSHVLAGTGGVNVNWGAVSGATGYKIYGRTTGAELLMATVGAVTTWLDDGSVTPSGVLPASNTTNGLNVNWVAVANATGYKIYGRTEGAEELLATVGIVTTWLDNGSVSPSGSLPTETTAGLESMLDALITVANQLKTISDKFQFDENNSVKATQTYPTGEVIYNTSNSKSTFATTLAEATDNYWASGPWIRFTSGQNINQIRKVSSYDGGTNFITVTEAFTNIPSNGDEFEIINK